MTDTSDETLEEIERLAEYKNIIRIGRESPTALRALTAAKGRIAELEKALAVAEHERLEWYKWNLKEWSNIEAGEWYAAFHAEMYPVRARWRKARSRVVKMIGG